MFLKNWITSELRRNNTNSMALLFKENISYHSNSKKIIDNLPYKEITKIGGWLSPEELAGFDRLQVNFQAIEEMAISKDESSQDHRLLAYNSDWNITIGEFKTELNKLSPKTRITIANNNLSAQMIEYLSQKDGVDSSHLYFKSNLLDSIDVASQSYDLLKGVIKESDLVGSLGDVSLSVKDLRRLFTELSKSEREKFLGSTSQRRKTFKEIMVNQFWLNHYDRAVIEADPFFKKKIIKYKNRLLAELFYKSVLWVSPI